MIPQVVNIKHLPGLDKSAEERFRSITAYETRLRCDPVRLA